MSVARNVDTLALLAAAPPRRAYAPAAARLRAAALELARERRLGDGAFSFRFVPRAEASGLLAADGPLEPLAGALPAIERLAAIVCGVCTLGPAISDCVGELFAARRPAVAVALDELGNELLLLLGRRAEDRMLGAARRRGWNLSGELRAGDPGLRLDAQPEVLRLADAAAIGVTLTPGLLMRPLKSSTVMFGAGRGLPDTRWSRCEHCRSRARCTLHAWPTGPTPGAAPEARA